MKKIMAMLTWCSLLSLTGVYAQKQSGQADSRLPPAPEFQSADANKKVSEFSMLVKTYAPAIRTGDSARLKTFNSKVKSWQQGLLPLLQELTPEERTRFLTYMQSVNTALKKEKPAAEQPKH